MFVTILEYKRNTLFTVLVYKCIRNLKNLHKPWKRDGIKLIKSQNHIIKQSKEVAITKSELIPIIADQPVNIIYFF